MAVPRNLKNGPLSPRQRATCLFCKKKLQTDPRSARRGGSAAGGPRPPRGDRGVCPPTLYKATTLIPSSFEAKNPTKNPEKNSGVRRREAAKPCRIAHL